MTKQDGNALPSSEKGSVAADKTTPKTEPPPSDTEATVGFI